MSCNPVIAEPGTGVRSGRDLVTLALGDICITPQTDVSRVHLNEPTLAAACSLLGCADSRAEIDFVQVKFIVPERLLTRSQVLSPWQVRDCGRDCG
jgi:hypothetical protein